MRVVGAFEAKNKLGQLLDRVKDGEEITITRHGKEVARLVPHRSPQPRGRSRCCAAYPRPSGTTETRSLRLVGMEVVSG